ncbi:MAG: noncanonical pyrimidine nucleotidase, YjjG family [Marinilabiliales bacterium]|nr:MAG: noncanonical pyrimidine nucleotidase, YjjG family [Marinilabiliales bacterium]
MKNYTHIIFDLDRTLFDFERGAKEALKDLHSIYVAPHSEKSFEEFHTLYKVINNGLWDEYRRGLIQKEILRSKRFAMTLEELNIHKPDIAVQMGDMYVRITAEKAYLFPYTLEILEYLKSKYELAIMTNGFKEVQYPKLDRSGIRDYFKYIFISEEIGVNKPDIKIFNHAVETMNTSAEYCLMVGDDFAVDIEGAANAGIDQIYFNPALEEGKHELAPTFRIRKLKEMEDFL